MDNDFSSFVGFSVPSVLTLHFKNEIKKNVNKLSAQQY